MVMDITFTKQTTDDWGWEQETEVETWSKAEHAVIDCDTAEELLEAGIWIAKHSRTIADYELHEGESGGHYIEIWKKK